MNLLWSKPCRQAFLTLPAVAGCTRIRTTPPFLIRSRLWIAICQKSRSRVNRIRPSDSARSRTSLSPLLGKSLPAHTTSWLARRRYSTTRRGKFSFSENQHLRRQGISTEFVRKMTGISKTGKQSLPVSNGGSPKAGPFQSLPQPEVPELAQPRGESRARPAFRLAHRGSLQCDPASSYRQNSAIWPHRNPGP